MATAVYILCFFMSALCGALLVRSYLSNRTPLLLWTAGCFVLLALNNLFVVLDLIFIAGVDLRPFRVLTNLAAITTLLYGFIWKVD